MRHTFGQVQDRALIRPTPEVPMPAAVPAAKEIPYDYVATFTLKGERGNREQDVINISTDGAFVSVAIGYSFIISQEAAKATKVNLRTIRQAYLIDFKYSIIDSGTGRELQNKPIHNIAGLGEPMGNRPFRPLAKPMVYLPRSTIRIEIEEVYTDPLYKDAELFIVVQGYKILGYGTGQP
jgi:hypothetical protein